MNKKSGLVVIGFLTFVIGLVISIQLTSTTGGDPGGLIPVAQVEGSLAELQRVRAEKEKLTQDLLELEDRLAEYEKEQISEDQYLKSMAEKTEEYKMAAGLLDVKGPGVIVTVDDPPISEEYPGDYSKIVLRYENLLILVNKMKEAGAEAISINGHRIINTTEVSLAGNNININGLPTAPPYEIKAIGNSDTLESALTMRYGVVENMRTYYDFQVSVTKQSEITILRYSGSIRFWYAEPVESNAGEVGTDGAEE